MKIITHLWMTMFVAAIVSQSVAAPPSITVPPSALADLQINQAFGGRGVKSASFRKWLDDRGIRGELAALTDRRDISALKRSGIKAAPQELHEEKPCYLNQIRFLAYQLLAAKYQVEPLKYRESEAHNTRLLDHLVKKLRREKRLNKDEGH